MGAKHIVRLEPGCRVQFPADWASALGLRGSVSLERTRDGILVCPGPPLTWDKIFATKLAVGSASPDPNADMPEVTGDDLLF